MFPSFPAEMLNSNFQEDNLSFKSLLHLARPTGPYQAPAENAHLHKTSAGETKVSPVPKLPLSQNFMPWSKPAEVSHPVTKETLPLFSMWFPLGWYTERGWMYWCKLGIQGADELNCWMKCYCSRLHLLLLLKNTSCSSPARCTAHVNTPRYTLVHTNSTHLLK